MTSNAAMTSKTKAVSNIGVEACWIRRCLAARMPRHWLASYRAPGRRDTDTGKSRVVIL
jgi:hypothetical protein